MTDGPASPNPSQPSQEPAADSGPAASAAPPPPAIWYYAVEGKTYGPYTEAQLISFARAGYFRRDDYVYAEHLREWIQAERIAGLFDQPPPPTAQLTGVRGAGSAAAGAGTGDYAGFWIRFLAVFIDLLVLAMPCCLVTSALQDVTSYRGGWFHFGGPMFFRRHAHSVLLNSSPQFAMLVINWLYFALLESSPWQATLGKRAVGIFVADSSGRRLSFARATARYFASWLSYITFYVGFIIGAFTPRRQTLHDLIANTVVLPGRR